MNKTCECQQNKVYPAYYNCKEIKCRIRDGYCSENTHILFEENAKNFMKKCKGKRRNKKRW